MPFVIAECANRVEFAGLLIMWHLSPLGPADTTADGLNGKNEIKTGSNSKAFICVFVLSVKNSSVSLPRRLPNRLSSIPTIIVPAVPHRRREEPDKQEGRLI